MEIVTFEFRIRVSSIVQRYVSGEEFYVVLEVEGDSDPTAAVSLNADQARKLGEELIKLAEGK